MCRITGAFARTDLDLERSYAVHSRLSHRGRDDESFRAGAGPDDAGESYSGVRGGFDRYAAGSRDDHFFWFRLACFGWWQELARA